MLKSALTAVAALGLVSALGLPAFTPPLSAGSREPDPAMVRAGQSIFQSNCLQCHSVYEGQTSFGPNLSHEMTKPNQRKTSNQVRLLLRNGKGKMPAYGDKLSAQDTDNLIAYLRTL